VKQFIVTLPRNVIACFKGRMILWHLAAIALTFIIVTSGFDRFYSLSTANHDLRLCMLPAVAIGQLLPIILPICLLVIGSNAQNVAVTRVAWAIGQAALIGWFIASVYKSVTGRPHPPYRTAVDMSHIFRFGFMRGGIFWGWPSSHTATAFAVSVALFTLLPQKRWLGVAALVYACYIGIGVSMTIHWFSDFVAGAIIGSIIGVTVGRSFSPKGSRR
jgi:membrane-associated phospholipid phosphatase